MQRQRASGLEMMEIEPRLKELRGLRRRRREKRREEERRGLGENLGFIIFLPADYKYEISIYILYYYY